MFIVRITSLIISLLVLGDGFFQPELGQYLLTQFEKNEKIRVAEAILKTGSPALDPNFASSSPFITSNGFRDLCFPHVVDYNFTLPRELQCSISRSIFMEMSPGSCLYVASECFGRVVNGHLNLIPGPFTLVVHNGDQSNPDGQTDYKSGWLSQWETLPELSRLHSQGKLLAMHTENLWWRQWKTSPRPAWLHCLPIGLETRKYNRGANLTIYLDILREAVSSARHTTPTQRTRKRLLLIAFSPKSYAPDRGKALLPFFGKKSRFFTKKIYDHIGWLKAIQQHHFILCPLGHGLDTHRLWEVLLFGGIPVVRRSSISSCIDDSDNIIHVPRNYIRDNADISTISRGSIPVVIVNEWSEVTERVLEKKLKEFRLKNSSWDYSRVILEHWASRITGHRAETS